MKKLALVIALAVAASWCLSDRPDHNDPQSVRDSIHEVGRTIRRDVDHVKQELARVKPGPRPRRGRPAPPAPPVPPEPPAPSRFAALEKPIHTSTPDWFPVAGSAEEQAARSDDSGVRIVVGRLSASEDRARRDRDDKLARMVREWLAADVAPNWNPPARELARMEQDAYVQPVAQVFKPIPGEVSSEIDSMPIIVKNSVLDDVYTLYRAGGRYDFSSERKGRLVEIYRHEVVDGRLHRLGGGVALALAALAAMVVYIRADEATKGFYTNRLRLLTAAGLGASGYAVYRVLMHS